MSDSLRLFYSGNSIIVHHLAGNYSEYIFICFSARNNTGNGTLFSEKFLKKYDVECFFVCQSNGNKWWHAPEIFEVAKLISLEVKYSNKKIVLYGSSMGAYGAFHFRNIFNSYFSIAIAPQIYIDRTINSFENRWVTDLNLIQSNLIFDEKQNSLSQASNSVVFYDPTYDLDSMHVDLLKNFDPTNKINYFIEVPYSLHDVARMLVQTKTIQYFILSFLVNDYDIHELSIKCKNLYEQDCKSFSNYFRKIASDVNGSELSSKLIKFDSLIKTTNYLDFEALYMIAEVFFKTGRTEDALDFMDKSIDKYQQTFKSVPPNYLYLKKKSILDTLKH